MKIFSLLLSAMLLTTAAATANAETCGKGYINYDGSCVKQLKCKNGGVQQGSFCVCTEGWTGQLCNKAATCPYKTKKCANGYHATGNTCKSGKNTMIECVENDCSGYNYAKKCPKGYASSGVCQSGKIKYHKCDSCSKGFSLYQGECIKAPKCKNGGVASGKTCVCPAGWTGDLCNKAAPCEYSYKKCPKGYHATGKTCKSGKNTMYDCEVDAEEQSCTGYVSKCQNGYHPTSDTCQKGGKTLYKCEADTPADDGKEIIKKTLTEKDALIFGGVDYVVYNNSNISANVNAKGGIVGMSITDLNGVNSFSYKGNSNATIDLTQKGSGDVYGMRHIAGQENVPPEYSDGNRDDFLALVNAASVDGNSASGTIKIADTGSTDATSIYGIYTDAMYMEAMNSEADEYTGGKPSTGIIDIANTGNGKVYGIYSRGIVTHVESDDDGSAVGSIKITNNGNGNVYGIWSLGDIYLADATELSSSRSTITINNRGSGDIHGVRSLEGSDGRIYNALAGDHKHYSSDKTNSTTAYSVISVNNIGSGDVFGIRANEKDGMVFNAKADNFIKSMNVPVQATGIVRVSNKGDGTTYGIVANEVYTTRIDTNFAGDINPKMKATSNITVINQGVGHAYGIRGFSINNDNDGNMSSTIEIANVGNGYATGIWARSRAINRGDIKIHNLGNGGAVGIYADEDTYVQNSGNIIIDRASFVDNMATSSTSDDVTYRASSTTGGYAIGIYAAKGANVYNGGLIQISNASKSCGIWGEDNTVSIDNTGTIIIDGNYKHKDAIVLNGGKLMQNGRLVVSLGSLTGLNLNDFGGTVVASESSKFEVEGAISGDLEINNSVVENGFADSYTIAGMVEAADVSGLKLHSQSALFDAALQNDSDAVMTMKSFASVVNNKSLAQFLQRNYAAENNESLFATLKSAADTGALNHNLNDLFGKKMLSRLAHEDMMMLREVNFDMNNHLFAEEGTFAFGGQITPSGYENNTGSIGRYSLNGINSGRRSFALGIAISDVRSADRHDDNSRYERSFMMSAPFGYKTHGFELITAPKLGYGYGEYDRDGFDDVTYQGKVERRTLALMNEARYPLRFGKTAVVPSAEFNLIGYNIKGHEDAVPYSLKIKSQNHYSAEAGFALSAKREFTPSKNSRLSLTGGAAVYHEFADPYRLEVSMNGMDGSYKLRDDRRGDNRAVLRFGMEYSLGANMDIAANLIGNIDREYRTDADIDFKYNF